MSHPHRFAMVMAGGAGTRLWPLSRRHRPKQVLPLVDGTSLLELALERLVGAVDDEHRLICTSESFRGLLRDRLPGLSDEQILGEPVGRDTLNAVGLTAAVLAERDPDAVFAVLTADHLIEPAGEFRRRLAAGFELVEHSPRRFVTFGVPPIAPTSSYGYVRRGAPLPDRPDAFLATEFVEKPEEATARAFIQSGEYDWNSGMFVFPAAGFLDALRRFHPESHRSLGRIARVWDTPDRRRVLESIYPTLKKTSVDYGVMEPAGKDAEFELCVVPLDVAWTDIGSWTSYRDTLPADGDGNRASARTVHLDSKNVLAVSDDSAHVIATIGCEDLIIVHTTDATLICRADRDQDVKRIVERVDEGLR